MGKKAALLICSIGMLLAVSMSPLVVPKAMNRSIRLDKMTRIMMLPPEAEVTGMHVDDNGHFRQRHAPDRDHYKATVGVVHSVDWNNLPETVPGLDASGSQKTFGTESELPTASTRFFCKRVMP